MHVAPSWLQSVVKWSIDELLRPTTWLICHIAYQIHMILQSKNLLQCTTRLLLHCVPVGLPVNSRYSSTRRRRGVRCFVNEWMGRQHCNLSIHERSRAANLLLRIRWSAIWLICKGVYHITHSCTRKLPSSSSCRANLFMNYVIDECERGSFNCHGMMNVVGIRPTEFGYRRGKAVGAYCNRWHGDRRTPP